MASSEKIVRKGRGTNPNSKANLIPFTQGTPKPINSGKKIGSVEKSTMFIESLKQHPTFRRIWLGMDIVEGCYELYLSALEALKVNGKIELTHARDLTFRYEQVEEVGGLEIVTTKSDTLENAMDYLRGTGRTPIAFKSNVDHFKQAIDAIQKMTPHLDFLAKINGDYKIESQTETDFLTTLKANLHLLEQSGQASRLELFLHLAKTLYRKLYQDELTISHFEQQNKALELLQRARESANAALKAEIDEFLAL